MNDFLKQKEKSKKVDELSHTNPFRKYGKVGGASKDDYDYRTDDNSYDPELAAEALKKKSKIITVEATPSTKTEGKKDTKTATSTDPNETIAKGSVGILNGIKTISTESAKLFDKDKKENKIYKKYPDIDDKKLNTRLNRLRMEQQYSDLSGDTVTVKTGDEKAKDALNTIGTVAGIAGGLASVAYFIYLMSHGQKPSGK